MAEALPVVARPMLGEDSARRSSDKLDGGAADMSRVAAGTASSRSTSAGSTPSSSGSEADSHPTAEAAELPDFDYPHPLVIRNTFLDIKGGMPFSLDGFFEDREIKSCVCRIGAHPCALGEGDTGYAEQGSGACMEEGAALGGEDGAAADRGSECCEEVESPCEGLAGAGAQPPPSLPLPLQSPVPPPLAPSPVFAVHCLVHVPPGPGTCGPPEPGAAAPPTPPPSPGLPTPPPSPGSAAHHLGSCKPCAHAHTARGCRNGARCLFCHLCPPGELKRQQKAKRMLASERIAGARRGGA